MRRKRWFVYIVRAADETLYTGIARDVARRLLTHGSGKGSRYLRGRSPLRIVYRESLSGRSSALKREAQIKKFTRRQKLELIDENHKPQ